MNQESWAWWNSQFFAKAQPLLNTSAWIFVRGNHETCSRHGSGYFLLLDPRPYGSTDTSQGCTDATAPYVVPFAGAQFVVLDSSGATCDFAGEKCSKSTTIPAGMQVATWQPLIHSADMSVAAGSHAVVLTHRPVWGGKAEKLNTGATACSEKGRGLLALNSVMQTAPGLRPRRSICRCPCISGHTHTFELMTYANGSGPQLIAGNSGVTLTHPGPKKAKNCNIAGTQAGPPYVPVSTVNGLNSWAARVL